MMFLIASYIFYLFTTGTFEIEVYTPDGLADGSDNFTYDAASVDSISPASGSVAGIFVAKFLLLAKI